MMFEEEVWESVGVVSGTDYTGLYEVSNFGNVRSLDRQIVDSIGRKYFLKGTFLKPYKSKFPDVYGDNKPGDLLINYEIVAVYTSNRVYYNGVGSYPPLIIDD